MAKPTKKAQRRLAKPRGGKPRPGTGLARRPYVPPPSPATLVINDPHQLLPGALGDDAAVGMLGQVEIKLTKQEEEILSEPVQLDDIRMKPTGQPYLSHPTYTRWFNRAFGRLGWAIVQQSKPIRSVNGKKVSVVCPYMLYIHRQPAAFALGEQEYFEDSQEQTYGDAYEATVASALRRCAKRLGVGLELWDKIFLHEFITQHCVMVAVQTRQGRKDRWRRKTDPKLPGELGGASQGVADAEREEPYRTTTGDNGSMATAPLAEPEPVVTKEQRQRLGRLITQSGRHEAEVRLWLKKRYNVTSAQIRQHDYQQICDQIRVRGVLPMPGDGE